MLCIRIYMKNWMKTFVKLTLSKNLNDLNQNKLVV